MIVEGGRCHDLGIVIAELNDAIKSGDHRNIEYAKRLLRDCLFVHLIDGGWKIKALADYVVTRFEYVDFLDPRTPHIVFQVLREVIFTYISIRIQEMFGGYLGESF